MALWGCSVPCSNQNRVSTVPDQMLLRQHQASHYTNAAQVIEGDYSAEICLVTHQGEVESNSQICTLLCEAEMLFLKILPLNRMIFFDFPL